MTLCMAAKFKGGTLCASDLAISTGGAKRDMIAGKWWEIGDDALVLWAGALYYAQEVMFNPGPLRQRLIRSYVKHKDDDDDDGCEMLYVNHDEITYYEETGAFYDCGNYGCIGSGADLADGLLDMVYAPNRSEAWLRAHMDNIFRIVNKKVEGVSREAKYRVVG